VDEQFKIIDQDNESVFIPLKIPVTIEGSEYGIVDEIFSSKDLAFLNQFGVRPVENYLDGSEIWGVYETLINQGTQKRKDKMGFDIKAKIDFRTLQGIISKFTFSLMLYSKDYQSIRDGFGEEKFGYMYFSHWDDVRTEGKAYSYEYGLNSKAFNDANFI
jgi:CRISPR-associated endonuclease/helicase Cas3